MNVKELSDKIGMTGVYTVGGMKVDVVVNDAKISYGNVRYSIQPVHGIGSKWVDAQSVYFPTGGTK